MQSIPREQIIKRIQSLPETLQDAYFSEKTADAIGKTCRLRDIDEDLMSIIARLTGRILVGYLRPESFVAEIQKETGVSEMTAQLVAHDIDGEVFSNVRLELKKLYPPIIQTPTIQSPSFGLKAAANQSDNSNLQPKPKYVIPIPEKFKGQDLRFKNQDLRIEEPGIMNQDLRIKNYETEKEKKIPEPTPAVQENVKSTQSVIRDSNFMIQKNPEPTQIQQKPEITKPQIANSKSQPEFKPIVPLPTFIRSQFKMEEPKAKDFIDKFGAPDPTLAKPTPSKEDQYREKV